MDRRRRRCRRCGRRPDAVTAVIDVLRQTVARGLLGLFGQDPNTHTQQLAVAKDVQLTPGKALELDGLSDEPSPLRDDSTAGAARRLLNFHGLGR